MNILSALIRFCLLKHWHRYTCLFCFQSTLSFWDWFIFMSEKYSSTQIFHHSWSHSVVDGHLGNLWIEAVANKAAMIIHVQLFGSSHFSWSRISWQGNGCNLKCEETNTGVLFHIPMSRIWAVFPHPHQYSIDLFISVLCFSIRTVRYSASSWMFIHHPYASLSKDLLNFLSTLKLD